MRLFQVLVLASCFFYSCSGKKDVPSNVLSTGSMQEVLWDLLRAQELAQHQSVEDTTIRLFQMHTDLYDKVFSIHGTTKKEFSHSLNYYQGRPDLLKPIFDTLNNRSEKLVQLAQP
jgi:hypothetical protein